MFGYTGDALANFWGLIGVGVALGAMAVTLAHRIWRGLFFSLAGLFVLSGLLSAQIKAYAPTFAATLSEVTANPSNGFLVFMVLMVALWLHQFRKEVIHAPFRARDTGGMGEQAGARDTLNATIGPPVISAEQVRQELETLIAALAAVEGRAFAKISKLETTVTEERGKIYDNFQNAETARLSQIARIREETHAFSEKWKTVPGELLHLFDWAVNRSTAVILQGLLADQPHADKLAPPEDDKDRLTLMLRCDGWVNRVHSVTGRAAYRDEISNTIRHARYEGGDLFDLISPADRPQNVDVLKSRAYYIAVHQCDVVGDYLQHVLGELWRLEISILGNLRDHLDRRSPPRPR